jgi:serine/threonine protein kinase
MVETLGGESSNLRRDLHVELGAALATCDDDGLRSLVFASEPTWRAWGASHVVSMNGERVFVKRVPLTDVELAHPLSTRNLFRLPGYYSYGVGSAGFGAFRELATHEKTTEWVLAEVTPGFPLLYHHRVMPRLDQPPPFPMPLEDYVAYWNSSQNVARYIHARQHATHEVWFVVEFVPHSVLEWITTNQERTDDAIAALCQTVTFLRKHGIVHFDAHFGNVLTDGDEFYLADFGLALDGTFDLTATERRFLDRHQYYDYGTVLWSLASVLRTMFRRLPPAARENVTRSFDQETSTDDQQTLVALIDDAENLRRTGALRLEPAFVEALHRYREVIVFMDRFFYGMLSQRKNVRYDDGILERLLHRARAPIT